MSDIQIRATVAQKITFASHQNSVPLIRELSLHNVSESDYENLTLDFLSDPIFFTPRSWTIDRLRTDDILHIDDLDVMLSGEYLLGLNEAVSGNARFTLRTKDSDSTVLASATQPVELLAHNEWGGAHFMPELLAAFCASNDPAVDKLLKSTSEILRQAGRPPHIDGYTSGSRQRVWEIISALWSALTSLRLDYALPPSSFETTGQKIRLPSQILDSGRATCLDLALFLAGALEQAGFNPILVFTTGHAFAGAWLQPEQFSKLIVDEASTLRKRIDLKELLVFETTLATNHPPTSFSASIDEAKRQIAEEREQDFILATDIRRARMQRVRPLASQAQQAEGGTESAVAHRDDPLEAAPQGLPDFDTPIAEIQPEETSPQTRLDRWQRKLLDLSLRNRLLNFRATKKSVKIFCPDPSTLEDRLADGKKMKIVPAPSMEVEDGRSSTLHHQRTGEHLTEEYAKAALLRDELLVELDKKELESRLVELFRTARSDLQEGGSNTLFLALGFLVWKKDDSSDRKFRAPLILIPVTLERKSVRSGVRLSLHDDEPRFNTTLLEMLRQDFNLDIKGFDGALPEDSHGVDVTLVWNQVRQEVKEVQGFEVVEEIVLGLFSFAKYLMWKDLVDRTDHLKENDIVRHLIETPRDPYAGEIEFPNPETLDEKYSPADILTPLPADSSQLSAVLACAKGKDFVLLGPPGTGKSQTIANMIAHNLAEGRKVLFVSEKIAALDVVYRRLREVGLGEFCLELHSNKARKTAVLEQLRQAWDRSGSHTIHEWKTEAERLKKHRDKLNRFVQRLHHQYANGLTPYLAMGCVVHDESVPFVSLQWPHPDTHSSEDLDQLREVVRRIDINAAELGKISGSPLSSVHTDDWSPGWQEQLIVHCATLSRTAKALVEPVATLALDLGLSSTGHNYDQLMALAELAEVLPLCFRRHMGYSAESGAGQTIAALEQACTALQEYRKTEQQLSGSYAEQAWQNIPIDDLATRWKAAISTWWPLSFFQKRSIRKELRSAGGARHIPDVAEDLVLFDSLRTLGQTLASLEEKLSAVAVWEGFKTEVSQVQEELGIAPKIRRAIAALGQDTDSLVEIRSKLKRLLEDGNDLLEDTGPIGRTSTKLSKEWSNFQDQLREFASLAGNEAFDQLGQGELEDWLSNTNASLSAIIHNKAKLNTWCAWRRVRNEASELGLENLILALENGGIDLGGVEQAFETNYARWWINTVVDSDEVLRTFVSAEHEATVKEFRALDDKFSTITQQYIRARLSGDLPSKNDVTRGSEFGILKRELEKRQRHKPLRRLVTEMPTALPQLTPCLLMSPLSIAQYLPAGQAQFDIVIFDEASQITTWDAIGAIARAKHAVIVGDPKQLPPTSFFNRSDEEADEEVDLEGDLESILDECLGASLPEHKINWHYRSEHESLIAFSNHHYYGGGLVTFPSARTEDTAVKFRFVEDAVYERAGARSNAIEAQAVVAEVVERLKNQLHLNPQKSIGIVTFNSEQQRLIEDLLDNERRKSPQIEPFFSDDLTEPVFVKNLESVQGDERDIMFFSLTYGPDRTGHMTMNFGPMNKEGGERRLNVAITRARSELVVFSSFRPEQIDLSRTQAVGVRDLKHFMEYAERGPHALAEAIHGSVGGYDSPFEKAVANRLRAKGWRVESQIGVSAFRIDLGVVHPDNPGVYLAGVECDGATYHRSATARDRDKVREQVLRRLGWNILRVWSTDWWIDPVGATEKLQHALEELLNTSRAQAEAQADTMLKKQPSEQHELTTSRVGLASGDRQFLKTVYRATDLSEFGDQISPKAFNEKSYTQILSALITRIVEVEGPIHEDLLIKRVARAHGFQRAGRLIQDRVRNIARKKKFQTSTEGQRKFYWPAGVRPDKWSIFRVPEDKDAYRSAEEICQEELRALIQHVKETGSAEPMRDVAKAIGISRVQSATRKRLEGLLASFE